ncbi:bifunctional hydroxymethylpyrimidine kinase/phosphomethylpyrimidine kinase [Synechococcus sp. CCY 9618]|uniref:bifunctional hydroxymethylpyrimidine kinase/phosphomethylpyrimidine kinase n=1 Tax=Synechococcus sp. CCY 9618 TaxID=2815602 RepID=UPI001C245BEC|nr:bifunctional hydroxymethylpyrimidine kinase/phosphomethylpyrimidine kinase [Synechococcus sp. CCY 9618]
MSSAASPSAETPSAPVVVLSIGGSDSGGGAGIQADLKTFLAFGVHGCSAITCVTAQNTCGVSRVDALPPEAVTAQVEAVCSDLGVVALKTGMLFDAALIEATAAAIEARKAFRVIDPVMVSRSGASLLAPEAITAMARCLLPLADLVTPNLHEARLLTGLAIASAADMERAAARLCELGAAAALVKGGGLAGLRGCDVAWIDGEARWFRGAEVVTPHSHGSGCTLSAAITACIGRGETLTEAISTAKAFVEGGLRHALAIGAGQGPLCHWHRWRPGGKDAR